MKTKEPLWKKIRSELSSEIPGFEFGQSFYTLSEICQRYGVSQITARRVLAEMEQEGLVERIQKRGTIVRNARERVSMRLILPDGERTEKLLTQKVTFRIHAGLISEAARLRIDFTTISADYLSSLSVNANRKMGLLILQCSGEATREFIRQNNLPSLYLHPPSKEKGIGSVMPDLRQGGYLATKHLVSLGHRRVGLISGHITDPYFLPRFKGYLKALKEGKIRFDWSLIKETSNDNILEDKRALKELLSLPSPPTAIFAGNDYRAMHLLEYCRENNLRVPEELSIVGYDNIAESALTSVPLTTIDTHLEELGARGINLLLEMMTEGRKKVRKDMVIKPGLVVRESSGPPPTL